MHEASDDCSVCHDLSIATAPSQILDCAVEVALGSGSHACFPVPGWPRRVGLCIIVTCPGTRSARGGLCRGEDLGMHGTYSHVNPVVAFPQLDYGLFVRV